MNRINTLFFCLMLAGSNLPSATASTPLNGIVAVVNNDIILASDLALETQKVMKQLQQSSRQMPPPAVLEKQVLERLILRQLQLDQAKRVGIQVDEETLNQTILRIAKSNNLSLSQLREEVLRSGISYESFREDMKTDLTLNELRQRMVQSQVNITQQEIDNYLASKAATGHDGDEYHLRHILIEIPEAATESDISNARNAAEEVLKKIKEGANFADMAVAKSQGQQALNGGDLGWRSAEQIPSLFTDAVAKFQPGDVSELIQSASGFHIIKLEDVRKANQRIVTQTKARHILLRPNEVLSGEQARDKLNRLRERLLDGESFAEIATAHSDDVASGAEGGSLGWLSPGATVSEFEEVMDKLQTGEISAPFATRYGWHLVQVLERREHDDTDSFMRAEAQKAILERKSEETVQLWLRRLREEAYVDIRLN